MHLAEVFKGILAKWKALLISLGCVGIHSQPHWLILKLLYRFDSLLVSAYPQNIFSSTWYSPKKSAEILTILNILGNSNYCLNLFTIPIRLCLTLNHDYYCTYLWVYEFHWWVPMTWQHSSNNGFLVSPSSPSFVMVIQMAFPVLLYTK